MMNAYYFAAAIALGCVFAQDFDEAFEVFAQGRGYSSYSELEQCEPTLAAKLMVREVKHV